jgi:hypothetical protein
MRFISDVLATNASYEGTELPVKRFLAFDVNLRPVSHCMEFSR